MTVVRADTATCQGYANCVESAPSTFALGDDGLVTVVRATVEDAEHDDVVGAVRDCPVSALRIEGGR